MRDRALFENPTGNLKARAAIRSPLELSVHSPVSAHQTSSSIPFDLESRAVYLLVQMRDDRLQRYGALACCSLFGSHDLAFRSEAVLVRILPPEGWTAVLRLLA